MTRPRVILLAALLVTVCVVSGGTSSSQGGGRVVVVDTTRGTFAFELFPDDAPVSTAHLMALVEQGFYDGLRVHRALPGFVVQFGDPQTRDDSKRPLWGRGAEAGSGRPVGVAEVSATRQHAAGTVGLSHLGDPAGADSQIYITLAPRPDLNARYAIVGQVIEGSEIPARLQVADEITRAYLRP